MSSMPSSGETRIVLIGIIFHFLTTHFLQVSTCAALKTHLSTHGGNYQCSFCGGTFYQLSSLKSHERKIHGKTDFFNCGICEEKFNSKMQMKEHLKHEHEIRFTKTVTVYDIDFEYDNVYDN